MAGDQTRRRKGLRKADGEKNNRVSLVLKTRKNYNDIMNNIQASVDSHFHAIFFWLCTQSSLQIRTSLLAQKPIPPDGPGTMYTGISFVFF